MLAAGNVESIATYLASLNPVDAVSGASPQGGQFSGSDALSLFATISAVYREADSLNQIENPGLFPDAWVGAEWRPSGPIAGRVTACTSCHNTRQGLELELAEALIELDLTDAIYGHGASQCAAVRSKVRPVA
ncbi:MAG: hypothetical protein CMJ64_04880 [Planctomycetaceae bacterium]|nr:hypothetical protein [Planctomycetaceae bacterium]